MKIYNTITNMDTNQIIIYQGENGETRIEVKFTGDTVWLSQQQMAELYQTTRPNIVQHILDYVWASCLI